MLLFWSNKVTRLILFPKFTLLTLMGTIRGSIEIPWLVVISVKLVFQGGVEILFFRRLQDLFYTDLLRFLVILAVIQVTDPSSIIVLIKLFYAFLSIPVALEKVINLLFF